jgi:hypothetical protein
MRLGICRKINLDRFNLLSPTEVSAEVDGSSSRIGQFMLYTRGWHSISRVPKILMATVFEFAGLELGMP